MFESSDDIATELLFEQALTYLLQSAAFADPKLPLLHLVKHIDRSRRFRIRAGICADFSH